MKFLIIIPHYNHPATLRQVCKQALAQKWPVLVADDGSDHSPEALLAGLPVTLLRYTKNRGKGAVILDAAEWAYEHGFTHIITLDADGQHDPSDCQKLVRLSEKYPRALVIGVRKFDKSVPASSRFGRKFGGFWVHFQTGKPIRDIQSGYRCYPVEILRAVQTWTRRYTFEVEIVVRARWAGFDVRETKVSVKYPETRISHFGKFKDNWRLTLLNTYLTMRSMLPLPHRQFVAHDGRTLTKKGYWQALLEHLRTKGNITKNACAAAWGVFCGSLAFIGVRQVMLFFGAGWWNLNRIVVVSFEKLCIGPFIPALCIEVGYYVRYGHFLTEFNLTTLGRQFMQRVWEWIIGSLIVAPCLAAVVFIIVWTVGFILHRSLRERN